MAAKAQEISMEAGSKMAAAMKDVINAAAGISSFAMESARDLVQYMVRRGQMTQEEADKLIREVEEATAKRKAIRPAAAPEKPAAKASAPKPAAPKPAAPKPAAPKPAAKKQAAAKAPAKKAVAKAPAKKATPAKTAAKKPAKKR
jgi:outer membrane biosynthesis protein TonB